MMYFFYRALSFVVGLVFKPRSVAEEVPPPFYPRPWEDPDADVLRQCGPNTLGHTCSTSGQYYHVFGMLPSQGCAPPVRTKRPRYN